MKPLFLFLLLICLVAPAVLAQKKPVPINTPAMVSHYGHGTPLLTTMKGLDGKPYSVTPLKEHWTLLYFWADWCIPCIEKGIPELSNFVRSTPAAERNRYRIVAIRFNSLSESGDWNDFRRKTERLEKGLWHQRPPFPIVYDSTTRVTSAWGVHALPTTALIDPNGNLVRDGSLEKLRQALAHPPE